MHRKTWILLALLAHALCTRAQGVVSVEAGLASISEYQNYYTPAASATYLKMVFPHLYVGGSAQLAYYSFIYRDLTGQFYNSNFGTVTEIDHHSSYLFTDAVVDVSIGEKQYFHLFADFGPGFYLGGSEGTTYQVTGGAGAHIQNVESTVANNNRIVYGYGFGVSEYIPLSSVWDIKLSQQYRILGRALNTVGTDAPYFQPNRTSFTIGVSYYYDRVFYKL